MIFYLGEQMTPPPSPDPHDDRRKFKRRYLKFSVRYRFNAEGVISDWKASEAGNFSAGGLFMTFGEDFHLGRVLELEFAVPGHPQTIKVQATIRWLKTVIPNTMVECGLEFSGISPEDQALLDSFAQEPDDPAAMPPDVPPSPPGAPPAKP